MKIAVITDTNKSAIWRLASGLSYPEYKFKLIDFHPKKPSEQQIKEVKKSFEWADLVHVHYWKSGSKIKEMFPDIWKLKTKVLTHHNPYNLKEENWDDYKHVCVMNESQKKELPNSTVTPHCINLNLFKYNENYVRRQNVVHMSVARIEGKKGVLEVAQACKELEYKFILVGRPSDPNYLKQVLDIAKGFIDYRQDVSDQDLVKSYYESAIHVCNSVDNFESGTLCILEAMACGVAVLTRRIGMVPDIHNRKNLSIMDCEPNNIECIKSNLSTLMSNRTQRLEMIKEGLQTVSIRGYDTWSKKHVEIYKSLGF